MEFKELKELDRFDIINLDIELIDKIAGIFRKRNFFFPVGGIIEEGVIKVIDERLKKVHFVYFRESSEREIELQDYIYNTNVIGGRLEFKFSAFLQVVKKEDGLCYPTKTMERKRYSASFSRLSKSKKRQYIDYSSGLYMLVFGYFHMLQKEGFKLNENNSSDIKNLHNNIEVSLRDNSSRNTIYIGEIPITTLKQPEVFRKNIKKKFSRKMEGWTVRGHYRNLKNGKRVFVKAYTKGNKNKISPKDYKFSSDIHNDSFNIKQ